MTKSNQGEKHFEGLFGLYLQQRQIGKSSDFNQLHLDEDILTAFVEGSLTQREATPVLKHLIDCNHCRSITVQLTELTNVLNDFPANSDVINGTNGWQTFWNNLTESAFRPYDNAVVAHKSEKEFDKEQESEPGEK